MNNIVLTNIIRFVVLFLIQALILKRASIGWEGYIYFNLILYPLFIMLLPLRTPKALLVLLGFAMGLAVDIGYSTLGVHASAMVATAYIRSFVINRLEPREGYTINQSPNVSQMGFLWFAKYAGILLFIHLLIYFSVDAFSPVYWQQILQKTIQTFIFSYVILIITVVSFNPKE